MKPNKQSYVIGLTGTIASGKSTTARYLESAYGLPRVDADLVARQVVEDSRNHLADVFGAGILEDGHISRPKLGHIVFADAEKLKQLNQMVHPETCRRIGAWIREQQAPVVLVEAIELLRSDLKNMVDTVWVVYANPEVRMQRLMQERGLTREEAAHRIASQWDDSVYQEKADQLLDGSGDTAWLQAQCDALIKMIGNLCGKES